MTRQDSRLHTGHKQIAVANALRAAPILAALLVAGCQLVPKTAPESSKSDWEHSNLYNAAAPCPTLFVEIDAIEGQGPSRGELRDLREFLEQFCDKPGGITIKVDNIIPKRIAAVRSADSLAIEYFNGPPDSDSAFLYLFFYNTRLRGKNLLVEKPMYVPFPYPIIWIDRSYHIFGNPWPSTFARAMLLHEAGHALGLCATTNHHAAAGHCTNPKCRMHENLDFNLTRFLTLRNPWTNRTLCADCLADLAANKTKPAVARFDFWHGYFRRREEGYEVLGRPGLTYVQFGEPLTTPSEHLLELQRAVVAENMRGEENSTYHLADCDPKGNPEAFARFTKEKHGELRELTRMMFERIVETLSEQADGSNLDEMLEFLTDEFIALAEDFPEQQRKLNWLREELTAAPGYGAQFANRSPAAAGR